MKPTAYITLTEHQGRKLVVQVHDDRVEIWRQGDRKRRHITVPELWRLSEGTEHEPPPLTPRRRDEITAYFIRISRGASVWMRIDTREEMPEKELMRRARIERRPIAWMYCEPPAEKAKGVGG